MAAGVRGTGGSLTPPIVEGNERVSGGGGGVCGGLW